MFEFLKQLDERLYVRYQTLERNIKAIRFTIRFSTCRSNS